MATKDYYSGSDYYIGTKDGYTNDLVGQIFTGSSGANKERQMMEDNYGRMNQESFNYYKDTFRPVEGQLIGLAQGLDTKKIVDGGLQRFNNLAQNQYAMQQRNLHRFGVNQYAAQRKQNALENALNNVASSTNYANTTRNNLENANLSLMQDAISTGRGLNTNAMSSLGNLAANSNQINNQAALAQAQGTQNTIGLLSSLGNVFLSQKAN